MTDTIQEFNAVVKYDIDTARLEEIKTKAEALKVTGVDDNAGYKKCQEARMFLVKKRGDIEKQRQGFKAKALEYGRDVDSQAKGITKKLLAIEADLRAKQDIVDDEKKRIKMEAETAALNKFNYRMRALLDYNCAPPCDDIKAWSDEEFDFRLEDAKEAFEQFEANRKAEVERVAKLEEDNRILQEKLDSQKKDEPVIVAGLDISSDFNLDKTVTTNTVKQQEESAPAAEPTVDKDAELWQTIKNLFPTLGAAWDEIFRLYKGGSV